MNAQGVVDARNIQAPLWVVASGAITFGATLLACGLWMGINVYGTGQAVERMTEEISRRPTLAEVRNATVEAVRPLETSMAQMKALIDILDRRVQRLEDGDKHNK